MENELNNTAPGQLQFKRNIFSVPGGIKAIYNFTDGTFAFDITVRALGTEAQNSIPAILFDLADALNSKLKARTSDN